MVRLVAWVIALIGCGGSASSSEGSPATLSSEATPTRGSFVERIEIDGVIRETMYSTGRSIDGFRLATTEERAETDRLLRDTAAARLDEGMAIGLEARHRPSDAIVAEEEAQLPWLVGYAPLCRPYDADDWNTPESWARARAGAAIARGAPPGTVDVVDDRVTRLDAEHPGHPLDHVRGRVELWLGRGGDHDLVGSIVVGARNLTSYPDGGVHALYPEHPFVQAITRFHDGDCVEITGHVYGGYTTGHADVDVWNLACGNSFWTRFDAIEACADTTATP